MKLKIEVRPQEGDSTHSCVLDPVAQALRVAVGLPRNQHPHEGNRIYPGVTRYEAASGCSYLYASAGRTHVLCATPPAVAAWIKRWDETGEGEPFTFEIATHPRKPTMAESLGWF